MRNLALMWVLAGVAVGFLAADDGKPSDYINCDKIPILDSIKYISEWPWSDNSSSPSYPYGDSICKRIILESGNEIIPCLIEKIKDTTTSVMILMELDGGRTLYYTVSDIAIIILPYVVEKKLKIKMDILGLHIDTFDAIERCGNVFYTTILQDFFIFSKIREKNYENRIRFYNRIKKWYEKERGNWYFDTKRCKDLKY